MNRELNIRIVSFFRFAGKVAITVLLLNVSVLLLN